ncbi:type II CRISPR-associated endonuclease Cas1 [Aquabacterium sp.]|uniref:type II CRISPR-associated endonuclease Cas1 n=1 Tax=Aquabacterium sp. TaxID=1872578 RepID=UPI00261814EA|nr:type II CRISPR-associated endonuclease Cas1 [Aquabacterium sp.]MDD2977209.1 type II CRISPR-associated endonuclease Cas1 [Aquabacterium sp.]
MLGRIVEVADDHRHLCVHRGFMVIKESGGTQAELGHVPLDDILAVIANAHGMSYTNNLLVALAERGAPFVLCGANHNTAGMLWPIEGNFEQSRRMDSQLAASLPQRKRLWSDVVRRKLAFQAAVLARLNLPDMPVRALIKKVKSGDPDNVEAQGAKRYWTLLFGGQFRRDQTASDVNALLNYGYTVLRATTARAVIAAGLHPGLGLHHQHANNAMRLVDDLMEPFRPVVDLHVWQLWQQGQTTLTPDTKRTLAHAMYADLKTCDGDISPLCVCTQELATSLAQVYLREHSTLRLPDADLSMLDKPVCTPAPAH